MQFKGLKIIGFKSFADPVDVTIREGLTGIVGPNGCGKSNILEALRWVMGATSARAMRGGEMDDLIFSGASTRPQREHAEVSLILDNSSRTAPPELNDADELEIKRRLRRNAGSTYKINGRTVRAKDVQLLFADASTGANSPALVRQGQISELIGSKPQNRRRILEEAAGIAGLNTRRHEAELKLNAASNNLERLDEIIGEVEKQLGGLRRQAARARKYRALQDEIDTLETQLAAWRWRAAQDELDTAQATLMQARRDVEESVVEDARLSARETEARAQIAPLRDAETEAAATLGALKISAVRLEDELKSARDAIVRLEGDVKRIIEDQSREHNLREEALQAADRAAESLASLPSPDPDAQESARLSLMGALENARRNLETAENDADACSRKLAAAEAEARTAQSALDRETEKLKQVTAQITRLENDRAQLGDQAALDVTLQDARTALEAAEKAAEAARANAEQAEQDAKRTRQTEESAQLPVNECDKLIRTLEAEITGLERLLSDRSAKGGAPVMDAMTPQAGLERALAAALGDDLNASLDETAAQHWSTRHGDALSALPEGASPLSDLVDAPASLQARLSQCGLVSQDMGPRLQSRLAQGQRLVSREGDLWRWDGYVRTASAPSSAAEKLEQRARLETRKAELDAAVADSQRLRRALDAARKAANSARDMAQSAARKAPECAQQAARARETVLRAEQDVERLFFKSSALNDNLARLDDEKSALNAAISTAARALGDGPSDDDRQAFETARDNVRKAREDERAAHNALSDLEREQERNTGRRRALEREEKDWCKRANAADARLTELAAQRTSARASLDHASNAPDHLTAQAEKLSEQTAQAEDARRKAADTYAEAETLLREAEHAARQARDKGASARELLARSEARLEAAQRRETEIAETVSARFGCDLTVLEARIAALASIAPTDIPADIPSEGAAPDAATVAPVFDPASAETRLALLQRERDNLGGVNMEADAQVVETTERLETQLREREDLDAAIAKLREGVDALNAEGRKRLLEAFEIVAAHFKSLFETLFEGGEAHISLTDSDDPLQAGLEIFASPPGKRLSTLSLMSGGEQALTAAALIFAVFLSRPAPLCVLDEVDAPLDDANVDRFCRMLDEMRKRTDTRFIVITHNPVTMSRMDRLFGVTMQERGVSRLVSVDLEAAEQLVAAQ